MNRNLKQTDIQLTCCMAKCLAKRPHIHWVAQKHNSGTTIAQFLYGLIHFRKLHKVTTRYQLATSDLAGNIQLQHKGYLAVFYWNIWTLNVYHAIKSDLFVSKSI